MNQKLWNYLRAAGIAGVLGLGLLGCGKAEGTADRETEKPAIYETKPSGSLEGPQEEADGNTDGETSGETSLSGEIREISDRGFTINQAVEQDGDGGALLALPVDEAEMTLIGVIYDGDTSFSCRTIQGGASYEDSKGSPADLEEGCMVELQGSYEDGSFHATEICVIRNV